MNQVAEYIKYRRKAKKRHGIHSPFVYEISDKVLTMERTNDDQKALDEIIRMHQLNKDSIQITDLGAGSKKLNSTRRICDILRTSSSSGKYGKLLYTIAKYYQPKHILELGTSLGIGTLNLSMGNINSAIDTVEGCPNTAKVALKTIGQFKNIKLHQNSFTDYISNLENVKYDLIFIDGHHDGKALLEYIHNLFPYSHEMTIWILDDIRWSDSMFRAWNHLIADDNFHVSLDLFRMGILVKKSDQQKEHFTLRF